MLAVRQKDELRINLIYHISKRASCFSLLSATFSYFSNFSYFRFLLITFIFYLSLSFSTYYLRFLLTAFFSTYRGLLLFVELIVAYYLCPNTRVVLDAPFLTDEHPHSSSVVPSVTCAERSGDTTGVVIATRGHLAVAL